MYGSMIIEHLKSLPGWKKGQVLKKGTKIAVPGLTGWVEASGHLIHMSTCKETGQKMADFNRKSGTDTFAGCTITDPVEYFKDMLAASGGGVITFPYMEYYDNGTKHLGTDGQLYDPEGIYLDHDVIVNDLGDWGDFGYCIVLSPYLAAEAPEDNEPANTPGEYFEATRSAERSYAGTYKFDMKYYDDFKDKYQNYSAVDMNGSTWAATTVWDKVVVKGSAPAEPSYTKVKVYRDGFSKDNGTYYFPIATWSDWSDMILAKDTDDCDGNTWGAGTGATSVTRV